MELENLKIFGQVAGLAGLSLGVLLILFREVIRKNIFPGLTKEHGFQLLRLIIVLTWSVAILGIVAWAYSTNREKQAGQPSGGGVGGRDPNADKTAANPKDETPTTTAQEAKAAEREKISHLLNSICKSGVLSTPYKSENRAEVYSSVSKIEGELNAVIDTLGADSLGQEPLGAMRDGARAVIQNKTVFPMGTETPSEKDWPSVSGAPMVAIEEFRGKFKQEFERLQYTYDLHNHCDIGAFQQSSSDASVAPAMKQVVIPRTKNLTENCCDWTSGIWLGSLNRSVDDDSKRPEKALSYRCRGNIPEYFYLKIEKVDSTHFEGKFRSQSIDTTLDCLVEWSSTETVRESRGINGDYHSRLIRGFPIGSQGKIKIEVGDCVSDSCALVAEKLSDNKMSLTCLAQCSMSDTQNGKWSSVTGIIMTRDNTETNGGWPVE